MVTWVFLDWVRPGNTVLDIGALIGYFSLPAATLVGPEGQVHAFESTPSTLRLLRPNANRVSNVIAQDAAIHHSVGTARLIDYGVYFGAWNTLGHGRLGSDTVRDLQPSTVEVRCVSVDAYCSERGLRPSFIKIDIDGAEAAAVAGAGQTIARCRPVIALDVGREDYLEPVGRSLESDYAVVLYDTDGGSRPSRSLRKDVTIHKDFPLVPREALDGSVAR